MPGNFGQGFNYTNITTNSTTVISAGFGPNFPMSTGILHSIIINTPGAAGGTITIYDSPTASGEIVATITVVSSQWTATGLYDVQLNYGLTVVVAGMTTPDLTITWV